MIKKLLFLLVVTGISLSSLAGDKDKPLTRLEPMKIRERNARPDIPGTFLIEFGLSILQSNPAELEINTLGSRTVNMYYLYNINLPMAGGRFELLQGVGLGLDRYKFEKDITISEAVDTVGVSVDELTGLDVKKSMLVTNYLDIPIELRFYANPNNKKKSFKAGVGFKAGIRFSSHTKLKYKDDGNLKVKNKKNFGLDRFRYGVLGRIGVGGFNVFYYQGLSELFKSDEGPLQSAATNITIGLSFTGF